MASGDLIRKAREAVGESQGKFGERFGVDQSTVARWEIDGPPSRGPARKAIERELAEIEKQANAPSDNANAELPR